MQILTSENSLSPRAGSRNKLLKEARAADSGADNKQLDSKENHSRNLGGYIIKAMTYHKGNKLLPRETTEVESPSYPKGKHSYPKGKPAHHLGREAQTQFTYLRRYWARTKVREMGKQGEKSAIALLRERRQQGQPLVVS